MFGDNTFMLLNNKQTRNIKIYITKYKLDNEVIEMVENNILDYGNHLKECIVLSETKIKEFESKHNNLVTIQKKIYYSKIEILINVERYIDTQSSFLKLGEYKDSFDRVTKAHEKHLEYLYNQAMLAAERGQYQISYDFYSSLVDIDYKYVRKYLNIENGTITGEGVLYKYRLDYDIIVHREDLKMVSMMDM